jgi:hypothetical protein
VNSGREAVAIVAEHGAEGVAVIVRGRLAAGDVLEECGVTAQVKTPKPAPGAEKGAVTTARRSE